MGLGPVELGLLLLLVLALFCAGKLARLGRAAGRSICEFRCELERLSSKRNPLPSRTSVIGSLNLPVSTD